jgi:predicted ATPase
MGNTLLFQGACPGALTHLEQAIAQYNPRQHHALAFSVGQDQGVNALAWGAIALWACGYATQALARSQAALALAQELNHPHSLAMALCMASLFHMLAHDYQRCQTVAAEAIALAQEQGFLFFLAESTLFHGRALVAQGRHEEGLAQLHHGLASGSATGAQIGQTLIFSLLADVYGQGGQTDQALQLVTVALETAEKTGEHLFLAELYRLQGELMLQQCAVHSAPGAIEHPHALSSLGQAEAEAYLQKAIVTARSQRVKSLELRAVMRLSRLWQQQGKSAEARQLLAEVYGWFTEGFETKDLQEARILLEELSVTTGALSTHVDSSMVP